MYHRNLHFIPIIAALFSLAPALAADWPIAQLGSKRAWDDATVSATNSATDRAADATTLRRYIPMQLIVPGIWDGKHQIDLPQAHAFDEEGTAWTGPEQWTNPYTGRTSTVYDRRRYNPREGAVAQKMGIRSDGAAIGRAWDSRNGGHACAEEAKFPLGPWRQGEVRTYDYVCLSERDGKTVELPRSARITIEQLDYEYRGVPHSLRFSWHYSDRDSGKVLDHREYIFSPGLGLVGHARRELR
jgi:hypothetical protein